jgi:hypothetical protein
MAKFQIHPDGWALIENEAGDLYIDTPANLEIDSGMQCPAMPAGAIGTLYIPGRFNAAFDADGNQYGGDETCIALFDSMIGNVPALLEAKALREAEAAAAEAPADEPV